MRFSRNVLRSITPAVCRMSAEQDGLRYAAFLFRHGSGSPVTRSRMSCGYRAWLVYSGIVCFLAAIPTGDGERSRRRGARALLRKHIGFAMFSAGSPLGQKVEAALRPRPRLRQRVFDSLDSLHLIRDVGAFHAGKGVRGQRRLERLALVLRLSYVPIGMSYVRSRLLFAACAPNRTACDMFRFCSAVGRDRR